MKYLPLLGLLSLFAFAAPVQAARLPGAPADTVAGHGLMVRKLSQAMCAAVTKDPSLAFDKMSPADAMQFTQRLFVQAMQRDSVAFIAMIKAATKQGQTSQQVGQEIGKDVMVNLARNCPAAMPLVMRLAQSEQAQQAANAKMPTATEVEKKTLQPMANHLCAQLDAANAKQEFDKMDKAQRWALSNKLLQQEFATNRTKLLAYYSKAQLDDKQQREEIGKKIAGLMMAQGSCAKYLVIIGVDAINEKKP